MSRDGAVVTDVVGTRRRGGSDLVTADDAWHIGSCAKAITAVLYARLVERGDAEWGVPVGALFPDLVEKVEGGWFEPTVDELLTCRSGMRANLTMREMLRAWRDDAPIAEQRSSAVLSALARPPQRRGAFRYSNLGYVVVGAAIDRLAGMPFEAALHCHVFEPLGITSAGFGPPAEIHGHRAKVQLGGLVAGRGAPADPGRERSDNPAVMTPAGRLHLTLADWAKFQRIFLCGGEPLLRASTIEHLLRVPDGGRANKTMAMGWAPAAGLEGASYGMQGSNARWSASAIIDAAFERTAMVVANDGRTRVLTGSAQLAAQLLEDG